MNEGAIRRGGDTHHGRLAGRAGATSCSLLGLPVPRESRAEPAPRVNSLAPPGTPAQVEKLRLGSFYLFFTHSLTVINGSVRIQSRPG